jgi:ankyrin repeat protein
MRPIDVLRRPPLCGRAPLCALLLLAAGCTTTLNRAIERDQGKAVDGYLAAGANVNEPDKHGATPLINAAQFGNLDLMRRLVERGALVNAADGLGNSALDYLVSGETYKNEAVAFLLAHGADVNRKNGQSQTPLVLASARLCDPGQGDRQAELLSLLLRAGADPNAEGPTGELPLHLACFAGQPEKALGCLIQATRDPHALSFSGYGAFAEAARGDRRASAQYLAGQGFEPQMFVPDAPRPGAWPPVLDLHFSINARTQDFYGDFLSARRRASDAAASYRASAASYDAAIEQYRQVVGQYAQALKKEKSARDSKIMGTIALNVLGAGLGATTGVGFFVVPKRSVNAIDAYEDELDADRTELGALAKERSDLDAKIKSVSSDAPAASSAGT